jgi:hypothetical protein
VEQTCQRYVCVPGDTPLCFTRSEVAALAEKIGDRTVDVVEPKIIPGLVLLNEFGRLGVRAQFREPTWAATMAYTGWKVPAYPSKGDMTVCESRVWFPPATIRFHNRQFVLAEDGDALTLGPVRAPHTQEEDELGRPCFWQGCSPSEFELWNGTGRTQGAVFAAEGRVGPSNPDLTKRTVLFTLGGRQGAQVLGPANDWRLRLPLEIPPGKTRLALWVGEPATVALPPPEVRDLLLLISDFRLEPAPALQAGTSEASPTDQSLKTKE